MARRFDEALALARQMKQRGVPADHRLHGQLVYHLVHLGRLDDALEVLGYLHAQRSGRLSLATYNLLLDRLGKHGRPHEALALFQKLRLRGVPVDAITYNTLMDAFKRADMHAEALRLFEEMRAQEMPANAFSYSIAMHCMCHLGRLAEAEALLERARAHGPPLHPCPHLYTSLIAAFARRRRLSEAWRLLEEMRREGLRPDAKLFAGLVYCFAAAGAGRMAMSLLEQARAAGLGEAETRIWNACISGLVAVGHERDAHRVLARFEAQATALDSSPARPNHFTYLPLLERVARRGDWELAQRLLEGAQAVGVKPRILELNLLLKAFLTRGEVARALQVFQDTVAAGLTDIVSFNTLLRLLVRARRPALVLAYLTRMRQLGLAPDNFTRQAVRELFGTFCGAASATSAAAEAAAEPAESCTDPHVK